MNGDGASAAIERRRQKEFDAKYRPQHIVNSVKGVKGVRLKHFESVVASVLSNNIQPEYVELPAVVAPHANGADDWPFDRLPACARVRGDLPGQLSQPGRAKRKEDQIRSVLRCILALIDAPFENDEFCRTIVDFGGGSGHLAIPLALLLPSCRIICVDLSERSLDLLHQKAKQCGIMKDDSREYGSKSTPKLNSTAISNLFTFHGSAGDITENFDMAVALHLCGEATDVVLRLAGKMKASSIVVAPCCVGKLNADTKNPYIYQATGQNTPTIRYPQSNQFCQIITEQYDWNALAKAADYSDWGECRTSRNAARRTAKALLETDRRRFLEESFGYRTAMMRMEPWEATPKNDIIVAWLPDETKGAIHRKIDTVCQADIQLTIDHLLIPSSSSNTEQGSGNSSSQNRVDWSFEEEEEVRKQLADFLADATDSNKVLVFPTRMGGRKRKLVHYMAEQMGLAHWCEGERHANKTVAVARRGRYRKPNLQSK